MVSSTCLMWPGMQHTTSTMVFKPISHLLVLLWINLFCIYLFIFRLGTWRIAAHYEGDKENAATVEFEVQKFGKHLN